MNQNGKRVCPISTQSTRRFVFRSIWLFGFLILSLLAVTVTKAVEEPNEQYVRIYEAIEQADSLSAEGRTNAANAKYQKAQAELMSFKRSFPTWNQKLVSYRLNDLAGKIAALSRPSPPPAAMAPPAEKPAAKPRTSTAMRSSGTKVRLLNAGAEPRQVLRLHPKPGDKQTAVMTVNNSIDMGTGQVMKMPAMQLMIEASVKSLSADGSVTYEMVVSDASVQDGGGATSKLVEAMKGFLPSVKGLSIVGAISDRGFPIEAKMKMPPGNNPQMHQLMEEIKESMSGLAAPLPEEAVGPGAKWEVKQVLKSQGVTINQTAIYELVSVNGDRFSTKSTISQSAARQKIESPAMPGLKVEVTKLTGTATGTTTLLLTQLLPLTATSDSQTEIVMTMNVGARKQPMTMKSRATVRIEAK